MAMPWELDKPVQPPAAMPWEMDKPVEQSVAPIAKPVATGGMLDLMNQPSRMPNSIADTFASQQPDQIGADFSQFFKANPADMSGIPATTSEQSAIDLNSLRPDIRRMQNEDIGTDYKLQELAKAPTDLLGAPQDASTMIANANLWGLDKLAQGAGWMTGNDDLGVDYRVPMDLPGSSDWFNTKKEQGIDSIASLLASMSGLEPMREGETLAIAPEDVSPQDRMLGAGLRFGAGGALGGGLAAGTNTALAAPYAVNASKTLMGDVLAGGGGGVVQQAYDEYMPDSVKETIGPIGDILAAMLGGVGGATVNSAGHAVAEGARNAAKDSKTLSPLFTDPSVPVNPDTNAKFKPSEMDMTARIMQNMPSDIDKTVANLRQMKDDFAFAPPEARPTTGMGANDIGMALNENAARTKDPQRFLERDAARNDLANKKIDQSVPSGAEPLDMTAAATRQYDDTINAARSKVEDAKLKQSTANIDITQQNADLTEAKNRQNQSSAAIDSELRKTYEAEQTKKNELYAAKPDNTEIDAKPIYEEMMALEDSVPRAARVGTDYANASKRIRDLIAPDETGKFTPLTYGDLKILKTDVGAMRKEAVAAGRDVSQLDKINKLLSSRIDEINPEAAANYADNFAPKFKTGKMGEFTSAMKRAAKTGEESSATRPSETASKFLTKPEDAASLQRAIDVNGKPVTAENATQWFLGDLAKSNVLTENADLRYDKFKQWADKNKDVIDQFPAVRTRIDVELDRAARGGKLSKTLANDVKMAEGGLKTTEDEMRRSALAHALDADPTSTISSIMKSKNPVKKMEDLSIRLSPDKKAKDGLKASVRDWIKNEAETTAHVVGYDNSRKMSRAALDTLFKKHEKTLAAVYSPAEMNSLRQAHKLLDVAANLESKATAGSNTLDKFYAADKATVNGRYRMLEVALKAKYGVLAGGGKFRTLRLFFDALGSMNSKPKAVENALLEAQFNPELAEHLLTRNVKAIGTPAWNGKLNRLLAVASGARDDKIEEDK